MKIGTRKSDLAIAYTNKALKHLELDLDIVHIDSTADLNPTTSIEEMGGKGVFTKEIEQSLIDGDIDIACHAFKDLTRDNDDKLEIACVLPRADFRDALIGNHINPRTIGTSSPRRIWQLKELYPGAEIVPIRGNIDTRIAKQENGEYDAIVLAKAGLDAMGITIKASRIFGTADMMPAPGQGVIALQTRKGDQSIKQIQNKNDMETWYCCMAEKEMLKTINGDCQTPIGALTYIDGENIRMVAKNFENGKLAYEEGHLDSFKTIGIRVGMSLL